VTSGWNPALTLFDFRFYYATSHSNSIVIISFVQAACSTSRSTSAYSISAEDYKAMPHFVSSNFLGTHISMPIILYYPCNKKLCFVKEEVFGIADGGPIIGPDHPAMLEMFAQPITGAL
jgi:hypothetical protein